MHASSGRPTRGTVVLAALAAAACFAGPASAELQLRLSLLPSPVVTPQAKASPTPGRPSLSVALGTPISVRLELINAGTSPIEILPTIDLRDALVRLYVVDPSGTAAPLTAVRWEVRDRLVTARALAPGERLVHETFLFGRLRGGNMRHGPAHDYLFAAEGRYELYARYECPRPPVAVESNHVSVTVGPPVPHWQELEASGITEAMEGRSPRSAEQRDRHERLEELLRRLPTNPYAPWLSQGEGQ
jgi:hypothetical protein